MFSNNRNRGVGFSLCRPVWQRRTALLLLACFCVQTVGCSRRFWRQQADTDVYVAVHEKLNDPRWHLPRTSIVPDSRSRFYDPYDPDHSPLPPDDPASHQFMHCADGKEGYKCWHEFGDTLSVENPNWLDPYTGLFEQGNPVSSHESVEIPKVNLRDAMELTYIHSRDFQTQLENVYLAALTLTRERFLLNTRFRVDPAGNAGGLFTANRAASGARSQGLRNGIGIQQLLPSGAQFTVDLINQITWNSGRGLSATSLAWGVSQPFLEAAGRKVRMEGLVQAERTLLAAVRTMARFRQTIFVDVAQSYLNLQRQYQVILNQRNNIRQLRKQIEIGRVGDSLKPLNVTEPLERLPDDIQLLPDGFSISEELQGKLSFRSGYLRWSGDITEEQEEILLGLSDDPEFKASAEQLIDWRTREVTSLNVLQLITQLNGQENQLEGQLRALSDQLDQFKIDLGLPPNVQLEIDNTFLAPFELIDSDLLAASNGLEEFAKTAGPSLLPSVPGQRTSTQPPPEFEDLVVYVKTLDGLADALDRDAIQKVRQDFGPLEDLLKATETSENTAGRKFDSDIERDRVKRDFEKDLALFKLNERKFRRNIAALKAVRKLLEDTSPEALFESMDMDRSGKLASSELPKNWEKLPGIKPVDGDGLGPDAFLGALRDVANKIREELLKVTQSLQVVQAGLRVEAIFLNDFEVPGIEGTPTIEQVVEIGLANRRDLMNARAEVMDARRQVEVTANALKSRLDLDVNGSADLDGGNATDTVNVSVDFKSPLDKVTERNSYNQALVNYQRARRTYMVTEDLVKQQIRVSWRQLRVARQRLEIDRQTVRNSALQYDSVVTSPRQTNALNLLQALQSLLNAQNSLVNDWVSYETNRLNIFRDMGIMEVNDTGIWQDAFYLQEGPGLGGPEADTSVLIPQLPELSPDNLENVVPPPE